MPQCALLLETYSKKCNNYNTIHPQCILLRKMLISECVYKK